MINSPILRAFIVSVSEHLEKFSQEGCSAHSPAQARPLWKPINGVYQPLYCGGAWPCFSNTCGFLMAGPEFKLSISITNSH